MKKEDEKTFFFKNEQIECYTEIPDEFSIFDYKKYLMLWDRSIIGI